MMKYHLLNGIKSMDWPPHSSDLNPIENVWAFFIEDQFGRGNEFLSMGRS
jgi:hypothetical protein